MLMKKTGSELCVLMMLKKVIFCCPFCTVSGSKELLLRLLVSGLLEIMSHTQKDPAPKEISDINSRDVICRKTFPVHEGKVDNTAVISVFWDASLYSRKKMKFEIGDQIRFYRKKLCVPAYQCPITFAHNQRTLKPLACIDESIRTRKEEEVSLKRPLPGAQSFPAWGFSLGETAGRCEERSNVGARTRERERERRERGGGEREEISIPWRSRTALTYRERRNPPGVPRKAMRNISQSCRHAGSQKPVRVPINFSEEKLNRKRKCFVKNTARMDKAIRLEVILLVVRMGIKKGRPQLPVGEGSARASSRSARGHVTSHRSHKHAPSPDMAGTEPAVSLLPTQRHCFAHSGDAALDVRDSVALSVRSLLCHVASGEIHVVIGRKIRGYGWVRRSQGRVTWVKYLPRLLPLWTVAGNLELDYSKHLA
ncbi:hypothetical protein PR048_003639 [Dryococelus australis]|uniref:Uncharacterized protein n=1 Tax=Dryococelus australis TaxID=614101 RepID=A0ABQ9INQ9_9NEOP|nr:hypothetical protein PR048_003639 [Dryococelus australis]